MTYYLCLALKLFVSIFCALLKINFVFDVGGTSVALASLHAGNNFENWRNGDMNNDTKKHNLSAQYLFNADVSNERVFVFHQCQPNHGTVFQASVITGGGGVE